MKDGCPMNHHIVIRRRSPCRRPGEDHMINPSRTRDSECLRAPYADEPDHSPAVLCVYRRTHPLFIKEYVSSAPVWLLHPDVYAGRPSKHPEASLPDAGAAITSSSLRSPRAACCASSSSLLLSSLLHPDDRPTQPS